MALEIVFDGDDTLNEVVDFLVEYIGEDEDQVSGVADLSGHHEGFKIYVKLVKEDRFST